MTRKRLLLLAAVAALVACAAAVPGAHAVTPNAPTTALSVVYTGATNVTYTFSGYTLANSEYCRGVQLTFPAGTDVSGPLTVSPAGTVSVTGQQVTIAFTPRLNKGTPVTVAISGITNPTAPVTQTAGDLTFLLEKANGVALASQTHPTGTYSVVAPHLYLTVSPATIHFDLTPEVAAPSQNVTLDVDSSHSYVITRDVTGDVSLIGLSVTGAASGAYAAGVASHVDQYSAAVPWTTAGDAAYTANVTYTVIQQ